MKGTEFGMLHSARLQQQGNSMTGGHNASFLRVQRTPGSTRTRSTTGGRQWVKINAAGEVSYVEGNKHAITSNLSLHYRDVRMVDSLDVHGSPVHSAALLIRENALVVKFDTVRMIIDMQNVYILSIPTPGSAHIAASPTADSPFVRDLSTRVDNSCDTSFLGRHDENLHVDWTLPFELRALEGALHMAVEVLVADTLHVEGCMLPSLERLSHQVSRKELERVQKHKGRLQELLLRVVSLKQVLEGILDDDDDMDDMYLARRAQQAAATTVDQEEVPLPGLRQRKSSGPRTVEDKQFQDNLAEVLRRLTEPVEGALPAAPTPNSMHRSISMFTDARQRSQLGDGYGAEILRRYGPETEASDLDPVWPIFVNIHHIEGCESMLETYFTQLSQILSRLQQLRERISAAENLVALELDHRRNQLFTFRVVITVITSVVSFIAAVGSVMGMNLHFNVAETPWASLLSCTAPAAAELHVMSCWLLCMTCDSLVQALAGWPLSSLHKFQVSCAASC